MERIDRTRLDEPSGIPRWLVLLPVVALASSLTMLMLAAPGAGTGAERLIAQPVEAGAPPGRAEAIDPHPPARVDHIAALPDEEQAPTF